MSLMFVTRVERAQQIQFRHKKTPSSTTISIALWNPSTSLPINQRNSRAISRAILDRRPAGQPINHVLSIPDTCANVRWTSQRTNERMNINVVSRISTRWAAHANSPVSPMRPAFDVDLHLPIHARSLNWSYAIILREHEVKPINDK